MAFSNNPYLEDEYGGVSPDEWGADYQPGWSGYPQTPSGGGGGGGVPSEPLPYGNRPAYPVTTGIYGTQPPPRAYGMEGSQPSTGLGSRSFTIPSGGGGRVPGQVYGAGGPTGGLMTAPVMGPMPEFKLPTWDESKISAKTQRAAGPGLRELRKGMQEAQGRYYENPNVRRMTLRDAMAGYGMGLEKVMGGARQQATSEYAAEYGPQVAKAQAEYNAQLQSTMSQYQTAWTEYLARMRAG